MVIQVLSSWAGRTQWPLSWLQVASLVRVLGFMITVDLPSTLTATWERVIAAFKKSFTLNHSQPLDRC